MPPTHTVHLVDALPYVFRAYYSLPSSIVDADGRPANAVRGFADVLVRLLADEEPTHLGVAFDGSLTTSFRNDTFPAYKQQRELPPAELEAQLDACRAIAEALGAVTWIDDRYEADDIIATLHARLRKKGHRVVVVTADKDLAQLVDDDTVWFDLARGARLGPDDVLARIGVRPAQVPDYLGLTGDAVDNIPGVRGVGPKGAATLLGAYDDLEAIYDDLEGVAALPVRGAKSLAAKLDSGRADAFLSRDLARVATDAPASGGLRELAWRGADAARLDPLLEHHGIARLRARVPRWNER